MFDFKKDFFKDQFEKYPELLAFLSSNVDATADYYLGPMTAWMDELYAAAAEYLPDAQALELPLPIQELLEYATADKRSLELERTMLSLMSAYSIAFGNYLFFALSPVVSGEKVSQDQLKHLSELYNYAEYKPVVDLELVIGDLGKIRPLRQYIRAEEGIEAEDPDQFITALLQKGQAVCAKYLPSIANLSPEVFSELAKINTGFQFGHFAHAESTERELAKLKQVIDEHGADYLSLNMLVQCLDVAGAAAHNGGRLLLNQAMTESYLDFLLPILMLLKDQTPERVYEIYLKERMEQCELGVDQLASLTTDERVLGRLLCMLRMTEPAPAQELNQAFIQLKNTPEFIDNLETLTLYEADPRLQTPAYMSPLLVALTESAEVAELARNQGKIPQEMALNIGLRIIACCLKEHYARIQAGEVSQEIPISFNDLTRFIKEDASALECLMLPVFDGLVPNHVESQPGRKPSLAICLQLSSALKHINGIQKKLLHSLDPARQRSLDNAFTAIEFGVRTAISAEASIKVLQSLQNEVQRLVCEPSLESTVVRLKLEECISYCKQYMLNAIETAIINKAEGCGFDLGIGGSRHRITLPDGQEKQVPERVALIMEMIQDAGLSVDAKLGFIKELKATATAGHRSSTCFFFGRTQTSTNTFLANLECG
ncbi:hypothetical protein AVI51_14605 [Piscirickettsia salmonis]|uniref:Uncharacterized protein n=2 Tax=Bacteria TaxID=2 RepID=A0A9Q6PWN1_PISSA|nr:hypothetical protein [Piscirickettsia salmonis]ALA24262.1 ATPase [Piscirickettsia salmonis]APS44645.1 hypothetical protein AVI48_09880 [Piscirickettsia salmonis]APS48005.1 hypothetical protein AVI49_10485 [Piscirickettsia salmonis]APS51963.1 hypothetical protein AVI50_14760 [Piscirickettsia salmonis]APS55179.1 hypothetical protein AVI51_14605 [Piscirickettsia salmonis]